MIELKATTVYDAYWKANSVGEGTGVLVYLKSEADKVIAEKDKEIAQLQAMLEERNKQVGELKKACNDKDDWCLHTLKENRHHKYKRCLAMARMCEERSARYDVLQERHDLDWGREIEFYYRWYKRWLELAEKVKEAK